MKGKGNDYKLVVNITFHLTFSNLEDTMPLLHLLLTPDQKHQKVFHNTSVSEEQKV